jgi:hypothetical protein
MTSYKYKYSLYDNLVKNMTGGIVNEDNIFLVLGHGYTPTNPLNLFSLPGNIKIVPYSTCGEYAYFSGAELTNKSRRDYIASRETTPERIYTSGNLFPDMEIEMNTEHIDKTTGKKFFSYTGIISEDFKKFSFPKGTGTHEYYAWNESYNGTTKPPNIKALELHRGDIMPIIYGQKYKLSDIIHNISKKNINKTSYVFVLSCRGIDDEGISSTGICGDYKINFGSGAITRARGTMANMITKHFIENIKDMPIISSLLSMNRENTLEMINKFGNTKYIPISKFIFYRIGPENFELFLNLCKLFNQAKSRTAMYIINAEALCFIYKINETYENFSKLHDQHAKVLIETLDILLITKERREPTFKTVCDNLDESFNKKFPFLNKPEKEITEICKKIFKFEIKM